MTGPKYLYLITVLIVLSISSHPYAHAVNQSGRKTQVTATIPSRYFLRLFGYTAPNAIVQASGVRTFAQVSSDAKGYFLIDPLPVAFEAKEICVMTIDAERRTGFPFCIALPDTDKPTEIGPVLLSPTLSLSKGAFWQREVAGASGQTIPDAKVDISFFEIPIAPSIRQVLIHTLAGLFNPTAQAAGIPLLGTVSDTKGNFSVNLPSWKASGYRIFVKAFYNQAPTLKSQTLSFTVNPYAEYWWKYIAPKIILFLLLTLILSFIVYWERRTKKIRLALARFSEKRLKPFEVRLHLQLQRLMYNLREYLRSSRK